MKVNKQSLRNFEANANLKTLERGCTSLMFNFRRKIKTTRSIDALLVNDEHMWFVYTSICIIIKV